MERSFPIENRAHLPAAEFDPLASALARQSSIKIALDWLSDHRPPRTVADMVTQDEFSHDIIVDYLRGLSLVYDVT